MKMLKVTVLRDNPICKEKSSSSAALDRWRQMHIHQCIQRQRRAPQQHNCHFWRDIANARRSWLSAVERRMSLKPIRSLVTFSRLHHVPYLAAFMSLLHCFSCFQAACCKQEHIQSISIFVCARDKPLLEKHNFAFLLLLLCITTWLIWRLFSLLHESYLQEADLQQSADS